jgi:hypothetical protein
MKLRSISMAMLVAISTVSIATLAEARQDPKNQVCVGGGPYGNSPYYINTEKNGMWSVQKVTYNEMVVAVKALRASGVDVGICSGLFNAGT